MSPSGFNASLSRGEPAGQQPDDGGAHRHAAALGVLVTSSGPSPVELVVEPAVYRSYGGLLLVSGANAVATPLP